MRMHGYFGRKKRQRLKEISLTRFVLVLGSGAFWNKEQPGKGIARAFLEKLSHGITNTGNNIRKTGLWRNHEYIGFPKKHHSTQVDQISHSISKILRFLPKKASNNVVFNLNNKAKLKGESWKKQSFYWGNKNATFKIEIYVMFI